MADPTTQVVARLRRLAQSIVPATLRVDEALPPLRRLLADAAVPFKLVGDIAVIHHGYARLTDRLEVIVDGATHGALDAHLAANGFVRQSRVRLLHVPTGVRVDLLIGGPLGPYPAPQTIVASPRDPSVAGLAGLLALKLRAKRHQDLADIVALIKIVDDSAYITLEADIPVELRPALAELRRDALEELRFDDDA